MFRLNCFGRKTELETAIINRVLRVDYIIPLVYASINECDRCDISFERVKTFKKHIVKTTEKDNIALSHG